MARSLNIPTAGWTHKALTLPTYARDSTGELDFFVLNHMTGSDKKTTIGFSHEGIHQVVRVVVHDITTENNYPSDGIDVFLGDTKILDAAREVNRGQNRTSHANKPRITFCAADVDFSPYGGLDVDVFRAGDCEAYCYSQRNGWYEMFSRDVIVPALGECDDKTFSARTLPRNISQGCEAVLVATKSALLSTEMLNGIGHPGELSSRVLLRNNSPQNNVAVACLAISR